MSPDDAAPRDPASRTSAPRTAAPRPPAPRTAAPQPPARGGAVTASAPAKTNLALHVGAPGSDGYHPLETLFVAVGLRERVTVEWADAPEASEDPAARAVERPGVARLTVRPAPGSEYEAMIRAGHARIEDVPTDTSNLAARAALAVCRAHGVTARVNIHVRKAVPVAGGMGGGSADAAAALVATDHMLARDTAREPLGAQRLHAIAAELGADVPFMLRGSLAIGRGTGTQLEPVPSTGGLSLVVLPWPGALSTPRVYREWDALAAQDAASAHNGPSPLDDTLVRAAAAGDAHALAPLMRNELQPAALRVLPELAPVLERGLAAGALTGWVSGSGPTVCFLAADDAAARRLARSLPSAGPRAFAVSAPEPGARVEETAARP